MHFTCIVNLARGLKKFCACNIEIIVFHKFESVLGGLEELCRVADQIKPIRQYLAVNRWFDLRKLMLLKIVEARYIHKTIDDIRRHVISVVLNDPDGIIEQPRSAILLGSSGIFFRIEE